VSRSRFRSSGVLLHPTSLPSPHGIGDLGPEAYAFVDFLVAAEQGYWQVLPLGPTGFGDSPYASFSSHAGNPLLIDIRQLVELGDLTVDDVSGVRFPAHYVDYGAVIPYKMGLLRRASKCFRARATGERRRRFERFCDEKSYWLEDFALFMALKAAHGGAMWNEWEIELVQRRPEALQRWAAELHDDTHLHRYTQFVFYEQWGALRNYANERGIQVIGDIPIFVAADSADAWSRPEVFYMDERGRLTVVAGVPPDYFSPTGQRWGNPLYRWDVIAADNYRWWIERIESALGLVDVLRIDHFRGFQDYWEIPASEPTAVTGRWRPGPGDVFFDALRRALTRLPIIAEDLGMITDEVRALRKRVGVPGMRVLQFAFSAGPEHEYLPHNYEPDCVVYLGTHDNDTTLGWFSGLPPEERVFCLRYIGRAGHDIVWELMHLAYISVADTAVVTVQDLLKLDSSARMNTPGSASGNWQWRYLPGAITDHLVRWLGELAVISGRSPRRAAQDEIQGEKER